MTQPSGRNIRFALALYRTLLIAYPRTFRDRYGDEMVRLFRDRCLRTLQERGTLGFLQCWLRALVDLAMNAVLEKASFRLERGGRTDTSDCRSWQNSDKRLRRGDPMWQSLWKDLLFAARTARRQPGFTATAIITIALGTGIASTIFTIVDGVLLRPLPYPNRDRLVAVLSTTAQDRTGSPLAPPFLRDLQERCRSFEEMAGYSPSWGMTLTGSGEPVQIDAAFVSPRLFDLLGAKPLAGRLFLPQEYEPGAEPVVVVSRGFWEQRFGSGVAPAGQSIVLDNVRYTIIGIVSGDFRMPSRRSQMQQRVLDAVLFLPFARNPYAEVRRVPVMNVAARLSPGVNLTQARAELDRVARELELLYPATNRDIGLTAMPLREAMVGEVRRPLLVLLGAVGCLLLIACVNVANLLLARGSARERELSLRAALGAGRARIVRQLLVESIMMSTLGSLGGILAANWGIQALVGIGFAALPRIHEARIDARILAFSLLAAIGTGILFGIVPALQGARTKSVAETLNGFGRGGTEVGGRRVRNALVVVEIALALMLAIGAGLLVRSFWRLTNVDAGFAADRLTAFSITLPGTRYPQPEGRRAFLDRLVASISSLPTVERVGAVNRLPLSGTNTAVGVEIEGRPAPTRPDADVVDRRVATSDYFATMGIPLLTGRGFDVRDRADAVERVAIVNDALARRAWPGENPLGKRVRLQLLSGPGPWLSVVGKVRDVKHHGLDTPVQPELYVPYSQASVESLFVVVRAGADTPALAPSIRRLVWMIDPALPVNNLAPVRDLIADSVEQPRLRTMLFGGFALAAVVLAMIGIYGVVSYSVSCRTRDFGVRIALGAETGDIRRMVLWESLTVSFLGVVLGCLGSLVLTRLLASTLFAISPTDPSTFVVVSLLLVAVAILAAYVPARRATRVDPVNALRFE